ncbi:hypothetical protein D8B26_004923 [Coccidioides posadasii str. Silveira]|uniref:Uncharacterized protein n=1 Tax=Coccidioides posadasii (strain RMSCC 757 / Silveira) TaxID=443226 RepID=E9D760_COCPS|nr:conserved hypothetical protein [Coccidioides posadasii str. Silveira]QVM10263.1 hypothetical protein D8B26_004923 [Coccidioides posadasii str. Silveira]
MAAAPRERRKPVDGLSNLPSTREEWHEMAHMYLANARLQDICSFGRFSASTVTKEAFLTVRCIWDNRMLPDEALGYIIDTGAFFSQEHCDEARQFLNRKLLGSKQLTTFAPPPSSGSPTFRRPKRTRRSSPIVEDDPQSSPDPLVEPVNQITTPRPEIHPWISNELPDEVQDHQTPTETLVVNFMVTLLGGIALQLVPTRHCYGYRPSLIRRCVHMGATCKRSSSEFPSLCLPAPRGEFMLLMIFAIPFQSIKPGVYRTFMISQDYLSFHVSIGTYNDEYLNYIFGPGNAPVIPTDNQCNGFLHIQELGPFNVEIRNEMELLAHIILCLIVWQLDGKPEMSMIKTSMAGVQPDELSW